MFDDIFHFNFPIYSFTCVRFFNFPSIVHFFSLPSFHFYAPKAKERTQKKKINFQLVDPHLHLWDVFVVLIVTSAMQTHFLGTEYRIVNFVNRSKRNSFRLMPLFYGEWNICWTIFSDFFFYYFFLEHFLPENVCYVPQFIDDIIGNQFTMYIERWMLDALFFMIGFIVCCSLIDEKSFGDKNR